MGELPFSWTTWNKQVTSADPMQCGRYRPDFIYMDNEEQRVVIVECDEHAHMDSSYPLRCELSRQAQIALSFGGRPVIFIRYNPDTIMTAPYIKTIPAKERRARLLKCLQAALEPGQPGRFKNHLTVHYLFYPTIDAATPSTEPWLQSFAFARLQPDYEAWAERLLA